MELLAHAKQHLLGLLLVGLVFYVIERVMGARRRRCRKAMMLPRLHWYFRPLGWVV